MSKRKKIVLEALIRLGGEATTKEIAKELNLNTNGVSQTLGVMDTVKCLGGKAGDTKWKLK